MPKKPKPNRRWCEWKLFYRKGYFIIDCKHIKVSCLMVAFSGSIFCPFCGKRIKEVK